MYKIIVYTCLFIGLAIQPSKLEAQESDTTSLWIIQTAEGNKFIGFITQETNTTIFLKTPAYDFIQIPRAIIVSQQLYLTQKSKSNNKQNVPIDTSIQYRIELLNGNEYIGKIISDNADSVKIETADMGIVFISKVLIRKKQPIISAQIKNGILWYENLQSTRYYWAPNGYGLKPGEGYYQNVWVLINQMSVGVTKNLSVGAGIIPLFLFTGEVTPVWITPKISVPIVKDKLNLGAGVLTGFAIGEPESGFGIAYGVGTYGSKDANVTFGLGYGFTQLGWGEKPAITLSAMTRITQRGYLITENYHMSFDGESTTILSLGGRTVWRAFSLDYGFVIPFMADVEEIVVLPWLSFVLPFGTNP